MILDLSCNPWTPFAAAAVFKSVSMQIRLKTKKLFGTILGHLA
jgi:hypothetical protein